MKRYKPHDIVVVQQTGYSHYGEVLSLEIPHADSAPTYMVRCVPGEPTTLQEIEAARLRLPDSARRIYDVHYATVASKWRSHPFHNFPVDMLRYDFASPVNFKLVENDLNGVDAEIENGQSDLVIATATRRSGGAWTPERWSSFMWTIRPWKSVRLERK